jgi:polysaccharide pyruvyl transferase WcaK-like protein
MRPIAILFANLKGNVGDFAILDAMQRDIASRFPGRPIHLFTHPFLTVDDARVAAFRAASPHGIEVAGQAFGAEAPQLLKALHRRGAGRLLQAWLIGRLAARHREEARRFAGYEAVAVAGGDQWNGDRLGISMFGTVRAVAAQNRAVHAYPFSLNPAVRSFNSDRALRRHFGPLRRPLLVRDGISLGVAERIGLPAVLRPDCVFGLEPVAREIPPHPDRDPERTLLVVTRSPSAKVLQANRAALERLEASRRAGRVELLTTCAIEDGPALQALGQEFGVPVREPLTWQDTVAEMRAAAVVATNRLHGLILGSMAGAVMVPVADRKKSEAFVRDVGLKHFAPRAQDLTGELLERARAEGATIVGKLQAFAAAARDGVESPFEASRESARRSPA